MDHPTSIINDTIEWMRTVNDIGAAASILNWDQETNMPQGAAETRAEQIATLETLVHQMLTGEKGRRLYDRIKEAQVHGLDNDLTRLFAEDFEKASKLPEDLVHRTSRAQALSQETWKHARMNRDFSQFRQALAQLIDLKIEAAELRGYEDNRYDALLNLYEPGMTAATLEPIFENLRHETYSLIQKVKGKALPEQNPMTQRYPGPGQLELSRRVATAMGFSFEHGRIDLSTHPFCTSFSQYDVRLTTRINESDLSDCLYGVIHEAGHGLYEQGFSPDFARTFAADGASMGIHESQSLFWETIVTRSAEFWDYAHPLMVETFGDTARRFTPTDFYHAVNRVEPSLIRVGADEVTYNMHIILRFELENALINKVISVDDVPHLWNEKMYHYLHIRPNHDGEGCLQDIHWAFGGFGYFPSYTLGKLYAAMIWNTIQQQIPTVKDQIRSGNFAQILSWLRTNIHRYGRTEKPSQIIRRITGRDLTESDFVAYANAKVADVYGL